MILLLKRKIWTLASLFFSLKANTHVCFDQEKQSNVYITNSQLIRNKSTLNLFLFVRKKKVQKLPF